ncbi:expansin family protein, partial [Moniliophthora roreri]
RLVGWKEANDASTVTQLTQHFHTHILSTVFFPHLHHHHDRVGQTQSTSVPLSRLNVQVSHKNTLGSLGVNRAYWCCKVALTPSFQHGVRPICPLQVIYTSDKTPTTPTYEKVLLGIYIRTLMLPISIVHQYKSHSSESAYFLLVVNEFINTSGFGVARLDTLYTSETLAIASDLESLNSLNQAANVSASATNISRTMNIVHNLTGS